MLNLHIFYTIGIFQIFFEYLFADKLNPIKERTVLSKDIDPAVAER